MFVIHVFIFVEHVPALIFIYLAISEFIFSFFSHMNSKSLCFPAAQPLLNHRFNFVYHILVSHNTSLTFSYETTR